MEMVDHRAGDPEQQRHIHGLHELRRTPFGTQANALLRKNLTFQKRNYKSNCFIISFPIFLCILLVALQVGINSLFSQSKYKCGCVCEPLGNGTCEKKCGIQYSTSTQALSCEISSPPLWPAFLQVPKPEYRAVRTSGFADLPSASCRETGSCPVSFLYTGQNQSFAQGMATFLTQSSPVAISTNSSSSILLGTSTWPPNANYLEPAVSSPEETYAFLNCSVLPSGSLSVPFAFDLFNGNIDIKCAELNILWRDNYNAINDEIYKGFSDATSGNEINEISVAYDFGLTSSKKFDVTIAYNRTYRNDTGNSPPTLVRVSRSMNMAAQAFLRMLIGPDAQLPLWFVSEMPKAETTLRLDFASLLGPLFYMWVVQLLLPVILTSLVYEKQRNLRMMMKMHGLGDGPYWLISYSYFLVLSIIYMFCFVLFGSIVDLKFFRLNSYSIQFVFFFVYINLQIALGFLASTFFSNVKTATVVSIMYVFGSGLLGEYIFNFFLTDPTFSRGGIFAMELIPAFSLFRGLFELSTYAFIGNYQGSKAMQWSNLNDPDNGMKEALAILAVEWLLFLLLAYYLDQVVVSGSGVKKNPLFFLNGILKKKKGSARMLSARIVGSDVHVDIHKEDVFQERESVKKALSDPLSSHAIICDEIKKIYPGRDGNPPKFAVKGLSLAISRGECFGMLGPNGAGKTTSINMMTGLLAPSSGTIFIEGLDIKEHLDNIYSSMGVCPQHDLLWDSLTGREHLLFYGRLKNLKGEALKNAVDASLRSVNLFNGGVGDKQAGKYSGGMKRRLSVAISLIGNPRVVYMDEPSTGLDPASRSNLWNVVRQAKRDRAIILTTHSMEEAEILCDRLGIFVNGELQCIGNSKELKSRYGGSYVFSITTSQNEEETVLKMVNELSPNAKKTYGLSGTQKFELPKSEVKITDVFRLVEYAKPQLTIQAWGVADTTLEDVFIKVAKETINIDDLQR